MLLAFAGFLVCLWFVFDPTHRNVGLPLLMICSPYSLSLSLPSSKLYTVWLDVSYNHLDGTIPSEIGMATSFGGCSFLFLSSFRNSRESQYQLLLVKVLCLFCLFLPCLINSVFNRSLFVLPFPMVLWSIEQIDLRGNQLTGTIPTEFAKLEKLSKFATTQDAWCCFCTRASVLVPL